MNKIYSIISSLLISATAIFSQSENYFPLKVGNWWLYQADSRIILDRGDEQDSAFNYYEVIGFEEELGCPEPIIFSGEDGYLCFLPQRYHILRKIYVNKELTELRSQDTIVAYTNGQLVEFHRKNSYPNCNEDYVYGTEIFGFTLSAFQSPNENLRTNCGRDTSFRYENKIDFPMGVSYTPSHNVYGRNDNPVDGDAVYFENQVGLVLYIRGWAQGSLVLLESNLIESKPLPIFQRATELPPVKNSRFLSGPHKINGQKISHKNYSEILNRVILRRN